MLLIRGPHGRDHAPEPNEETELIDAMIERGVSSKTAADLVSLKPLARVRAKIEVFDWLVQNGDKRIGKNPAGYLVASIRDDYQAPDDYQPPAEADRLAEVERLAAEADAAAETASVKKPPPPPPAKPSLRTHWDALPASLPRRHHRPGQGRKPRPPPLENHARTPLPRRAGTPPRVRRADPLRTLSNLSLPRNQVCIGRPRRVSASACTLAAVYRVNRIGHRKTFSRSETPERLIA